MNYQMACKTEPIYQDCIHFSNEGGGGSEKKTRPSILFSKYLSLIQLDLILLREAFKKKKYDYLWTFSQLISTFFFFSDERILITGS